MPKESSELNILVMHKIGKDGEKTEGKMIHHLSQNEARNHKVLGRSVGVSMGHCLYLAKKYSNDLYERVSGFTFKSAEDDEMGKIINQSLEEKGLIAKRPELRLTHTLTFYEKRD